MSFYLDASVIVPVFREEPHSERVRSFLSAMTDPLFVSDFAIGEVSSAFARMVRMKEISPENADAFVRLLDDWVATAAEAIPTDATDIRLAVNIVRRSVLGLRLPDAIHIAAAQVRKLTLVARDQLMISAAEELGVKAIMP